MLTLLFSAALKDWEVSLFTFCILPCARSVVRMSRRRVPTGVSLLDVSFGIPTVIPGHLHPHQGYPVWHLLYGSILFLSCISIHRFLGICYPMQSLQWVSKHRSRLMFVGVWIAVITFQSPILYFSRTTEVGEVNVCYDTTSSELFEDFLVYSSFISIMLFCIPFVVVVVCYALMVRKLLEPSAGGACSSKSKQKSIRMIIIVLVVFMVCFLPFHLTRTLYYVLRYLGKDISCSALEGASIAYKVTRPLASANSCLDPILYFLAGQGIRKKLSVEKKKLSPKAGTAKLSSTQL